jgi:hypothetical protein
LIESPTPSCAAIDIGVPRWPNASRRPRHMTGRPAQHADPTSSTISTPKAWDRGPAGRAGRLPQSSVYAKFGLAADEASLRLERNPGRRVERAPRPPARGFSSRRQRGFPRFGRRHAEASAEGSVEVGQVAQAYVGDDCRDLPDAITRVRDHAISLQEPLLEDKLRE